MKKIFSVSTLPVAACVMAALTASSMPVMAESVDVTVIGTIIPAACVPTVSGGAVIDYGYIQASTLSATDYTLLAEKTLTFSLVCTAPAKVALKAIKGRPDTAAGVVTAAGPTSDGNAPIPIFGLDHIGTAGLGLNGTKKVGGYSLRIKPGTVVAGTDSLDSLRKIETETGWINDEYSGNLFAPYFTRLITWGASGTTTPVAITNLSGELSVQAYLNKSGELDLTGAVKMDGLTTIEVVYL